MIEREARDVTIGEYIEGLGKVIAIEKSGGAYITLRTENKGLVRFTKRQVVKILQIHKAEPDPQFAEDAESSCIHCHSSIKRVPGGAGTTWVHGDGAVVGSGPERSRG